MEESLQAKKDKEDLPPFLYKYRALNSQNRKWIERIFTHNEVYFPSRLEFKDPFDCRIQISFDAPSEDFRTFLKDWLKRKRPELNYTERRREVKRLLKEGRLKDPTIAKDLRDRLQEHVNALGVFCLSRKRDHLLMWSHYSEGHKGFCLEFKGEQDNWFIGKALEVQYPESLDQVVNAVRMTKEQQKDTILLTKAYPWKYEQEWRIIELKGPGVYTFPEELLTGVVFGCRMPEKDEKQIREWIDLRRYRPRLYRAKPKEREFGLDILAIG